MRYRILVMGSSNLELVENLDRFPYTDETIMVSDSSFGYAPGGHGANAAVAFSRLGGDVIISSKIGIDDMGAKLMEMLKAEGIDTRFVSPDKQKATGFSSVRRNAKGEKQIVTFLGANTALLPTDVEDAYTSIPDAAYVTFDAPADSVHAACNYAAKKGIPLFVDAGPVNKGIDFEKLPKINVLMMDADECYGLSGIKADTIENCLKASIRLSSINKTEFIIIKLGARGVFVYDNTLYNILPSHKVTATDSSGVGDVFSASLTYAFLQKKNILEAVRFATLSSAICVTRPGSALSAPTLKDVKQFAIKVKEAEESE